MTERRILVTGSRTWLDRRSIRVALTQYITENVSAKINAQGYPVDWDAGDWVIVHGACPTGADALAQEYALNNWITQDPFPANWKRYGKRAGIKRNEDMVAAGAEVCIAFIDRCHKPECRGKPPHGSHGATHCSYIAEAAGIEVRRITKEGRKK